MSNLRWNLWKRYVWWQNHKLNCVYCSLLTAQNDSIQMNSLTAKINLPLTHSDALSLSNFNIVLRSLIINMSKLDNSASASLITAVLRYRWLDIPAASRGSDDFVTFLDLYAQFVSVLVSSLPKYLHEVLKKLIREFPDVAPESQYPHHRILQRFVSYIPTCINTIPPILAKCIPHHLSASTTEIVNFILNSVRIVSYCPDLRYNVWQMVIECCIKLDVELQNELDDLDDEEIEDLINENDDEIDDDLVGEVEGSEVYNVTLTRNIKRLVSKLDSTLELILKSTANSFTLEELNSGDGVSLFNTLTSLFKTHILPTHFTKSTQFFLFHISQFQPELGDSFLVLLIDVAFSPNEILEKRLKALQYLSSYIARAKNLTKHQVVFIVSYLIGWINKYITEREQEVLSDASAVGGMERFKLFYASFQALLYIFCFRHKQLTSSDESGKGEWECDLDKFFQRVIIAKFNPLKYCDETVVYIFAKLATKLNVCYCYSIIEHNKRERMTQSNSNLPSSVGNFRHKQEFLDLEAYFPFDPLVLPSCKSLISANYVEWRDVNPGGDDDDDEDSGSHPEDDGADEDSDDDDDEDDDEDDDDKDDNQRAALDSDEEITSDEEDD